MKDVNTSSFPLIFLTSGLGFSCTLGFLECIHRDRKACFFSFVASKFWWAFGELLGILDYFFFIFFSMSMNVRVFLLIHKWGECNLFAFFFFYFLLKVSRSKVWFSQSLGRNLSLGLFLFKVFSYRGGSGLTIFNIATRPGCATWDHL
jgi:hypothetical protein